MTLKAQNKPEVDDRQDLHERTVVAVTEAVAGLMKQFGGRGLTPEACFEGAVKGAAVVMIAHGLTPGQTAGLLTDFAGALGEVDIGEKVSIN